MRWLSGSILAAVVALSQAGCGPTVQARNPLHYTEDAKRAYDLALDAFFDHDWEGATTLMQDVKRKYGYSRYARLADLRLADISYHQQKYAEAITAYKGFIHDYPNDPEVPYARYRVARSLFHETSASFLLPPLEERDLASVRDAYTSIQGFLADYPEYKKAAELRYMLAVVTGLLVRHELYVARFYLDQRQFQGGSRAHPVRAPELRQFRPGARSHGASGRDVHEDGEARQGAGGLPAASGAVSG